MLSILLAITPSPTARHAVGAMIPTPLQVVAALEDTDPALRADAPAQARRNQRCCSCEHRAVDFRPSWGKTTRRTPRAVANVRSPPS